MVKSSTTTEVTYAGQVVDYSYLVTNEGNVTLTNVTVVDTNIDTPPGMSCPSTTLTVAPDAGSSMTCTAQRTVTQAEIDAGGNLYNLVTADSDESDPDTDELNIPIVQTPAISINKEGTLDMTMSGMASCQVFRTILGQHVAGCFTAVLENGLELDVNSQ